MANPWFGGVALVLFGAMACPAHALDWVVGTTGAFATALAAAQPGDTISVLPGLYNGGHFRAGLSDVAIRKQPGSTGEAVFRGGVNGMQLSDATNVTIEGITFEQQTGNGLNIDDGGTFATPSTNITLRDLTVRDMAATGNNDGIKLSGVSGFLIDGVRVVDWGARGSAIDPVGSHRGLIRNSHFVSAVLTDNGSVIRPKGGSKDLAVQANLIELPNGAGRALQAGGSTGDEFLRFVDGDSGYEASDIRFEGNRVVGGTSAANWVNIDGGEYRYNDFREPSRWAMRILNERQGDPIVDTQNGVFTDNYVRYDGDTWSRAVNVGAETDAASFTFARNKWLNAADPTASGSTPSLPAPETDGEYGVAAPWAAGEPMRWAFDWGEWIVSLDADQVTLPIANHQELLIATPRDGGLFDPSAADPLSGDWAVRPASPEVVTDAFNPVVLIRPGSCALCQTIAGDYDRNGVLNTKDLFWWTRQYGYTGNGALADGNDDGVVDAADYTIWRDVFTAAPSAAVPEPIGLSLVLFAIMGRTAGRQPSG